VARAESLIVTGTLNGDGVDWKELN